MVGIVLVFVKVIMLCDRAETMLDEIFSVLKIYGTRFRSYLFRHGDRGRRYFFVIEKFANKPTSRIIPKMSM